MQSLIRGAAVAAAAAAALLVPAGMAGAAQTPALSWSSATGTYNYGTVNPGQTASQTFTLTNSGSSATSALTIALAGSAAFTKTADTCTGTSLGPKKSCTVTVTYAPAASGLTDTGMLTATSNKPGATVSLSLAGTSVAPLTCSAFSDPASGTNGTQIRDVFTLSGGNDPTGLLIITLTSPDSFTVLQDDIGVNGDGAYTGGQYAVQVPPMGNWQYTANYIGDGGNPGCTAYSTFTAG